MHPISIMRLPWRQTQPAHHRVSEGGGHTFCLRHISIITFFRLMRLGLSALVSAIPWLFFSLCLF